MATEKGKSTTQIDKEIRAVGETHIDLEGLTAVSGSTFIGKTTVDGVERFFEIKVTAKKADFDVEAVLAERKIIEDGIAARKLASDKKKANDEKRRKAAADKKALAEGATATATPTEGTGEEG